MNKAGLLLLVLLTPVLLCTTLAGCQSASYKARYEVRVTEAVLEENAPESGPRAQELAVKVTWTVESDGLSAHVTNPADSTAAILWQHAKVTHDDGSVEPLISTSPHTTAELPQSPMEIHRYGQVVVGMLPMANAEWEWLPNRAMGGTWRPTSSLFGIELDAEQTESDRLALAETAVGRKMIIELHVRTGTRVLRYIYDIRIMGAEVFASYH